MPDGIPPQTVDALVQQVEEQFDQGVDDPSRALEDVIVPQSIGTDQYRAGSSRLSFEQAIKLYLYQQVRGLSQSELSQRLEDAPYLRQRFDISGPAPTQQTLSRMWDERFSDATTEALEIAIEGIVNAAAEESRYINFDEDIIRSDDDAEGEPSDRETRHDASRKAAELARRHGRPHFETGCASNTSYSDGEIFDTLARICSLNGSCHEAGQYGSIAGEETTAHESTILRRLKQAAASSGEDRQMSLDPFEQGKQQVPEITQIANQLGGFFDTVTENVVQTIGSELPFDDRETIAAIDITYEQIWIRPWEDRDARVPNPRFPDVCSGYKKSAASGSQTRASDIKYGFKYATLSIVGQHAPVVLAVEPVKERSAWESKDALSYSKADIVERLLEKAQRFVDIDTVLCDREFYSHEVFNTIAAADTTYIIPKKTYEKDYQAIQQIEEHPEADAAVEHGVISGDGERSHEADFAYVPSTEEDGQYAVFATNQHVEPTEIQSVARTYRRRWDIEIEYKTIKSFLPRTSSMDYRVRFGQFVFATMLYNLWRLTDLLLKQRLGKRVREEPVVTARTFARVVGEFLREVD